MARGIFNTARVLAFAKTKPADEEYEYYSDKCALGQYLTAQGYTVETMSSSFVDYKNKSRHEIRRNIPLEIDEAVGDLPRTWGAFAKRLEAMA